ncbi:helix-turn-helix DNA-binding domain protein [Gordonia phage AnarQue]|nr:helix-turn-helix DNA-binding domain protein [Gordonia phage AnarQue]WNM74958.1 helix-turn-helix DNA binding domain protein [Gordonia phage MossRose]
MTITADDIAASPDHPDEEIWERRMRALTLRNGGATYRQIAERHGVSVPTARKDVRMALREVVNEPAEDMIARQRSVLADLQRAHFARALSGDVESTKVVLDVLKHEAQLFGLYAPARVAVGVTDMEFAEQAVELIAGLGRAPQAEMVASLDPERRAQLGLTAAPAPPQTIDGETVEGPDVEPEPWADI